MRSSHSGGHPRAPGQPAEANFSADEFSAAVSALANAFGDPTRREIYLYLREGTAGRTCSEVADHFDDLLATLLARSLQMLPDDQAAIMAEEVGFDYGRALAGKMGQSEGHRSMRTAVNAVADALTAHGFAAHTEADGEQLQIISQQCPFGEAAQQFPHVVCAVDRGMIRGMLAALYGETNPHFSASRPAGDANCITCV